MLASVATRLEKNPLVEVALDAIRLVVDALTIVALVVVELPTMRLVMLARVAIRLEKNPDCAVIPVPDAVLKLVCPEV